MKLLKDTKALKQEEFSNASPYVIMFGPDKCGTTNKVSTFQWGIFINILTGLSRYTSSSNIRTPRQVNTRRST